MTPPVWLQFGVAGLLAMGGLVLVMVLARASPGIRAASIMGAAMIGLFLAERFGAPPAPKAEWVATPPAPPPAAAPVIVHIHVDAVSPLILGAAGAIGFALAALLAFLFMRRRDRRVEPVETVKLKPASRALAIRGAPKLPNKFEDWS